MVGVHPALKQLYGDVQCQAFSPCSNFLIAGNIFGEIFIFDLRVALSPAESESERIRGPERKFSLPDGKAALSAASTDKFLVIGSVGRVYGYEWRAVCNKAPNQLPKVAFAWDLSPRKDELESSEVNSVVVSRDGLQVIAAGGDKQLHVFSLEDGTLLKSLSGHTDYIHQLALLDEAGVSSASEDGSVRVWDLRADATRAILEPHKESTLCRPSHGKWVGALHIDKEWMVCGGGVRSGLWHLPSLSLTTTFTTDNDAPCHAVLMHKEHILIGEKYKVSKFNLVGEHVSCAACSSNSVLCMEMVQTPAHTLLTVAGTSHYLDICNDMLCRDQIFACA